MPGFRKSAPDHRPSRLLVQEAFVLLILRILCIDVQSVEIQFNGTCHRLAIANMDPLSETNAGAQCWGTGSMASTGKFSIHMDAQDAQ